MTKIEIKITLFNEKPQDKLYHLYGWRLNNKIKQLNEMLDATRDEIRDLLL